MYLRYIVSFLFLQIQNIDIICALSQPLDIFPALQVWKDFTGLYFINSTFGTPGQYQSLMVDIAQPYIWVLSDDNDSQCSKGNNECLSESFYYSNKSSTAHLLLNGREIHLNFIDNVHVNGTPIQDNMQLYTLFESACTSKSSIDFSYGGVDWNLLNETMTIYNISFFKTTPNPSSILKIDTPASFVYGSLGLGGSFQPLSDNELSNTVFGNSFFFLDIMKDNNLISSKSYSLCIGDGGSSLINITNQNSNGRENTGVLLLGGVDPRLFVGNFVKFDTLPYLDIDSGIISYDYPIIPLTKVNIQNDKGIIQNITDPSFIEPVLLDSSYTFSFLPLSLIIQIALQTDAVYVKSMDRWLVSCAVGNLGASIVFEFGNLSITVPLVDLLISSYNSEVGSDLHFSDGQDVCILKLHPNSVIGFSILGIPFIKNIYMAVDLEDHAIAIGQAPPGFSTYMETGYSICTISDSSSVTTSSDHLQTLYKDQDNATNIQQNVSQTIPYTQESKIVAIQSGHIPYAVTNNLSTLSVTLWSSSYSSTLGTGENSNEFTDAFSSDGLIFTGKSFYNTTKNFLTSPITTNSNKITGTSDKSSNTANRTKIVSGKTSIMVQFFMVGLLIMFSLFIIL